MVIDPQLSATTECASDPHLVKVRVRLTTDEERDHVGDVVSRTLDALSIPGSVHLEFWDPRPPVSDIASKAALTLARFGDAKSALNTPRDKLSNFLEAFAPVSFGVWLGVSSETLPTLVAIKSNRERARSLPAHAAFVVCSLYDDNVEIFARVDEPQATVQRLREIRGVR